MAGGSGSEPEDFDSDGEGSNRGHSGAGEDDRAEFEQIVAREGQANTGPKGVIADYQEYRRQRDLDRAASASALWKDAERFTLRSVWMGCVTTGSAKKRVYLPHSVPQSEADPKVCPGRNRAPG